jgi:hypothetical protein
MDGPGIFRALGVAGPLVNANLKLLLDEERCMGRSCFYVGRLALVGTGMAVGAH